METRGRPSGREVLTFEGMVAEQEKAKKTRTYKAENIEVASQEIQKSVLVALNELKQFSSGERIKLEDTESVKKLTEQYLQACITTATLPKLSGLAHCLGYTRDGLYWFMRNKKDHPSGQFLNAFRDVCADAMADSSTKGVIHPIVGIFLLKALYGLRDNVTVETVPADSNSYESMTASEIVKRYGSLLEQEE